jgi:hypothetical protein
MRWHTDNPIRRLPRLRPLAPVAPVAMDRSDAPARFMLRLARQFYRRRLRAHARESRTRDEG